MNMRIALVAARLFLPVAMVLNGGCEKAAVRIPAQEVFIRFRRELDQIVALEGKKVRPSNLIQISAEGDFTRYLTGNGPEAVTDSWRPYPDREVLKPYREIIEKIHAHMIEFGAEGVFRVVFMNGEYEAPGEDGLIYQPDSRVMDPETYSYFIVYLGDGWYMYDRRQGRG